MKIDRLFEIVNILINKKRVTAPELAERFNVSVRTIYRDIEILSASGVPIYCTQGKGGGISVIDGYSIDKTMLSDDEQKQILMALESVNAIGNVEVDKTLLKLSNVFKKNEMNWIEIDFSSWSKNDRDGEKFNVIKDSIFHRREVTFTYYNVKGEKTNRAVQPYKLVFRHSNWYLYGMCKSKKSMRYFKLNRIENLKILDSNYIIEQHIEEHNCNYIDDKKLINIKLIIDKSMGFRVYDEFKQGTIVETEEGFHIDVDLPDNEWLYSYLLSYGHHLKVLEPLDIRSKYIEIIKNILNKYL